MEDVSICIIGYDGYKEVWDLFFEFLNENWANRPKTYLFTNELNTKYHNVETIPCGKEAEWSTKVLKALEVVESKYICLLLEDFFMIENIDNKIFINTIDFMKLNQIVYYKLQNQSYFKSKKLEGYDYLQYIPKNLKYGISLQPAIWDKRFLKSRVGSGNYNAWTFELNQNLNISSFEDDFYKDCVYDNRNILNILHGIVQSSFLRDAAKIIKNKGKNIELESIKIMKYDVYIKYKLKRFFSNLLPKSLNSVGKRIGRLMGIDFVSDRIR